MEKNERNMGDLLEILAVRLGCVFLSDLHQPKLLSEIQQALQNIFPKQFSLQEWQEAVAYITGKQRSFESQEQAADYLKNYQVQQELGEIYETQNQNNS